MAVEKRARLDFAKTASRQEALQTIFPTALDIFYHPIFNFSQKNLPFQQPQDLSTPIRASPSANVVSDYATNRALTGHRADGPVRFTDQMQGRRTVDKQGRPA